jgi:type IV pilus assembly protein PilN
MRLDINLASRPYEDARQFWLRWGTGLGTLAAVTLGLVAITVSGWYDARLDRAVLAKQQAEISALDRKRAQAEEFLNRPENRATRDASQFLNELIVRKSFSWTRVLEDLEKVMPPRVHLVSIHPELDEDNQLALKIDVAGSSPDRCIELAHRMEESQRFVQTTIKEQRHQQSLTGDTDQADIVAVYVPEAALALPPEAAAAVKQVSKRSKP